MIYRLKTPSKININLQAIEKKENGYHEIYLDLIPIALFDQITIEIPSKKTHLRFSSKNEELNEDNIILKAVRLMEKEFALTIPWDIHLSKNVPIGAGLGGGSANAAGILHCINQLFNLKLQSHDLSVLAKKIGSDVPFFIDARAAIAEGEGEKLTFIKNPPKLKLIIIKPMFSILSKEAFSTVTVQAKKAFTGYSLASINTLDPRCNAFWSSNLPHFDALSLIREFWQKQQGVVNTFLSGSGSALFAICENQLVQERLIEQNKHHKHFQLFKAHTLEHFSYRIEPL